MSPGDDYPSVALHGVAELAEPDWTDAGDELRRLPDGVAGNLNVAARDRIRHPAGCEVRFVSRGGGPVRLTLSAAAETVVRPFWGTFQGETVLELGPEPTDVELSVPEPLTDLSPAAAAEAAGAFDPLVCRLRFEPWAPVALHDVRGECRPPEPDEVPDRRYLAYGTSITEGAAASATHLTYVSRVARDCGLDPVNLGMSGAAYCEPAVADHIAERDDWEVATLSLSVNMANRGFTVEQFRERAAYLVETVAASDHDRPVVCVTLFPYHADLRESGDRERARAYREALASVVEGCGSGNVSLVDGRELSPADGLTTDLLHPGDAGMESIADGLAPRVADALDG
ncbi:SGNH/GDSL hydrolase family protein [Halosimplex halobium]|uniref:SGNH/GDSL hydrolase family protein n=1 Tax=Halosimplex halobium TaxID=3396618 RepID=UPI003F57EDD6